MALEVRVQARRMAARLVSARGCSALTRGAATPCGALPEIAAGITGQREGPVHGRGAWMAMNEATTPAGEPGPWGTVRITEPTNAGTWSTPLGQAGMK